eukprot:SAG31_NODE_43799_length_265_cov_0.939759_1_plen_29_part_10
MAQIANLGGVVEALLERMGSMGVEMVDQL